jgi:carboxymethylenebutenolidase
LNDMTRTITVQAEGGTYCAYVAMPRQLPAAAVVVLHEIFGVNADIRQTCDELAGAGFIAVAPDLFWRQEPDVSLNAWSDDEWKKGLTLYTAYDRDQGVKDIAAVVETARHLNGATGKVGVIGFCLGGLMTFLTATRCRVDAAVAYHGGDTEQYLDEASSLNATLLMHLAEEDEFISKEAQRRIKTVLAELPETTVYTYPGQKHAFARHTGAHYDAVSANLANARTKAFLAAALN